MDFKNKNIIITGAAGGIGKEIACAFLKRGANVACIDLCAKKLENVSKNAFCINADVSNEEEVKNAVNHVKKRFGTLDILVNAAALPGICANTEDYPFDEFKRIYEVNVFGTFLMMKYVLPVMKSQSYGAVVNFGSVSGIRGYAYESAYGSSKWSVIGLTKCVANENGGNGVRINSVSPGWVDTEMMKKTVEGYQSVVENDCMENVTLGPMERAAEPTEIAKAVLFLCSDDASYLNGTNLVIDGGMTLG